MNEILLYAVPGVAIFIILSMVSLAFIMSKAFLAIQRVKVLKNPGDYGMDYKDLELKTEDGITLSGWHIPENGDQVTIILHVGNFNKYGLYVDGFPKKEMALYDKDIELLKIAKGLKSEQQDVILFDMRNYGESGSARNGINSYGEDESKDLMAVFDYIKNHSELKHKDINILGLCFGGNVTAMAMNKYPEAFENVNSFVFVQPADESVFTGMNPLVKILFPLVKFFAKHRFGVSISKLQDNFDLYKGIKVPTLVMQAKDDPWASIKRIEEVYNNISADKKLFWIENTVQRYDAYKYLEGNQDEIIKWINFYKRESQKKKVNE